MPTAKYTNDVQGAHADDTFIERKTRPPTVVTRAEGWTSPREPVRERESGRMGDVDLEFDRGVGVGPWATASPRSTDASVTIQHLVSSTERLGISVSSPSSGGGGNSSSSGITSWIASVDWESRKNAVVSLLDYVYMWW